MSDFHVLDMAAKEQRVNVVFHIPVPDENNGANVNYRTALTQYQPKTESDVPWLVNPELAQVIAGEIYEYKETIGFDAALSLVAKRDIISAHFTTISSQVLNQLQSRLKFWGLDYDVT